jgi:hypothetical protein
MNFCDRLEDRVNRLPQHDELQAAPPGGYIDNDGLPDRRGQR